MPCRVSLITFIGLATMKVPSAEPQMMTNSHGCQSTMHVAAHGHEAAEQQPSVIMSPTMIVTAARGRRFPISLKRFVLARA